jgi:hypothetical protein
MGRILDLTVANEYKAKPLTPLWRGEGDGSVFEFLRCTENGMLYPEN